MHVISLSMEGGRHDKEGELEIGVVDAQEKSFVELLCEADPSIPLQAWESFGAYTPEFLSSPLIQWVPPAKMVPAGENTKFELRGASSNFGFCEEVERVNATGAEKIKMRERANRTSQSKFKCSVKSDKKPQKDVSWFNVNLKKDHLKERIAELYKLVNGSCANMPGLACVFQETKELIVSLLDDLKGLSSLYVQHSEFSCHPHGREHRCTDGLTSRGLCLVPTSTVAHSPLIKRLSVVPLLKDK